MSPGRESETAMSTSRERMTSRNSVVDNLRPHQQKRMNLIPPRCPKLYGQAKNPQGIWQSSEGNSSFKHDKDKGVNVQVILRCRPLSEEEVKVKTPVAISCNELRREVTAFQNMGNKQIDKTFMFDKVFGTTCKQKDLYEQAVAPMVTEALDGYNCTIFAYGQTGTGKTYTMQGEGKKDKTGGVHKDAGVIPRAVQQIFDILEAQNAEYSMKVAFIELYNEEVTDLLAPDEELKYSDDKTKKPIALMEDGIGAVFVRGLEEEIVCSADEIYKILEKGTTKKHIAETLLNRQSNRSHSLFTITIHVKECASDGVELIKCGKLNLVDLAGSENIFRSGAKEKIGHKSIQPTQNHQFQKVLDDDICRLVHSFHIVGRAREAGEINKSLLTLGRVINALVEHSGHVPYRDSKLTRLLRDSLGGKTKTCIIATVSPSVYCMEETLNSLDYAHRAKNIKNRPEVNQKVIKSAMIKDLYTEIDYLKQELNVTREKNGIYKAREQYLREEAAKKTMSEKLERMELDLEFKDKQLMELQKLYIYQQQLTEKISEKLLRTQRKLEESGQSFFDLEDKYRQANDTIKEKEYFISNLLGSERALTERAIEHRAELENAASELPRLFAKIENKNKIEHGNRVLIQNFHTQLVQQLEILHNAVESSVEHHQQQLKVIEENTHSFVSEKDRATEELRAQLKKLKDRYGCGIKYLVDLAGELDGSSQLTFGNIKSESLKHSSSVMDLIREILSEADAILQDLQSNLNNQEKSIAAFSEQQHESRTRTYQTIQSVSKITGNFFKMLSMYISKLTLIVEEAQTIDVQKLCAFEKNYEDYADCEERQLLNMVAELLASSNARKKKLVQTAADELRDCSTSRTSKLQQETSNMQNCTSSAREEWTSYVGEMEKHYIDNTTAVETGQDKMGDGLKFCAKRAKMVSERWRQAYESLLSQQRNNIDSIDSIIQNSMESNQTTRARLSSVALSALEEADSTNNSSLSYIEYLLSLDHNASRKISSLTVPCHEGMREMESAHSKKIVEISENAEKCLINEYSAEKPSCSAPRKQPFNLPSTTSIEELKTPAFDELLKLCREADSGKRPNGNVNKSAEAFETAVQPLDSIFPPTAIN